MASSSVAKVVIGATGPKISSPSSSASAGTSAARSARRSSPRSSDARRRRSAPWRRASTASLRPARRPCRGCVSSTSGPTCTPSSVPRPTVSAPIRSASRSANSAATDSCTRNRLAAVQASPMLRILASIAPVDGGVEVGVVEDQERRVAAQLHRDPQQLLGGLLDQPAPDLGGAGEGELAQPRVADQRLHHRARVRGRDDVEHAVGQPGLVQDRGQREHRQRGLRGRLDHHRAAGRDAPGRSCGCPSPAGSSTA